MCRGEQSTTTVICFSATWGIIPREFSRFRCRLSGNGRTLICRSGCGAEKPAMTTQTKPRFDPNSPEIKAYLNDLSHQFVREGMMVAFPTCLPGMTTPIPHDECHITALDRNNEGHIYGGTSGRQAHIFAAAFHGLTGVVYDMGIVPGCVSTAAVCCGTSRVIAFVN